MEFEVVFLVGGPWDVFIGFFFLGREVASGDYS